MTAAFGTEAVGNSSSAGRRHLANGRKFSAAQTTRKRDQAFLKWMRENGAKFDRIEWPTCKTGSGTRGAIARTDIGTGEHMVEIPRRLMMSEHHAKQDPQFGHVHRGNPSVLKSDNGLALYVMEEMLKGEGSFYWPYLSILPEPHNLGHWEESSLLELQDAKLMGRSAARRRHLRALHLHTFAVLDHSYPGLFPVEQYTFERFDFAWGTIQARAFGKRLSSSALVPLADCLNHGNVQTKYDFDVDDNDVFRLFPSGHNHYPKNAEVLNSYGRRPNDVLLLEYGFSMLDNEWDEVELLCTLPSWESLFDRRKAVLRASGQYTSRAFRLRRDCWTEELLHFNRCVCLTEAELNPLDAAAQEHAQSGQHLASASSSTSSPPFPSPTSTSTAADTIVKETSVSDGTCAEEVALPSERRDAKLHRVKETAPDAVVADTISLSERLNYEDRLDKRSRIDGGEEVAIRRGYFPFRALSVENELTALSKVVRNLQDKMSAFPTTLERDEELLRKVTKDGGDPPELRSALVYRITAKRLLKRQLDMAATAICFVKSIKKGMELTEPGAEDNDTSNREESSSSNRKTFAPPGSHKVHMYDIEGESHDAAVDSVSPSLLAYLAGLKVALVLPASPPPNSSPNVSSGSGSSSEAASKEAVGVVEEQTLIIAEEHREDEEVSLVMREGASVARNTGEHLLSPIASSFPASHPLPDRALRSRVVVS